LGHDQTGLNLRTNGLKSDFPVAGTRRPGRKQNGRSAIFFVHRRRSGDQLVAGLWCRARRQGICPNGSANGGGRPRSERDASPAAAARIECPWCFRGGRRPFRFGQAGWRCHRREVGGGRAVAQLSCREPVAMSYDWRPCESAVGTRRRFRHHRRRRLRGQRQLRHLVHRYRRTSPAHVARQDSCAMRRPRDRP
jgi:hypothetical protein